MPLAGGSVRHRRRRRFALSLSIALLLAGVHVGLPSGVSADGDGWQNANGTSKTATGTVSTQNSEPAKAFAFDTDNAATSCTSPQGSCIAGEPDGANSFEVFTTSPSASVTFAVTTSEPIACGYSMPNKVSFNGQLPYTTQDP